MSDVRLYQVAVPESTLLYGTPPSHPYHRQTSYTTRPRLPAEITLRKMDAAAAQDLSLPRSFRKWILCIWAVNLFAGQTDRTEVLWTFTKYSASVLQYFGVLRVVEDILQQLDRVWDMSGLSNLDNINGCEQPLTSQFETPIHDCGTSIIWRGFRR